LKSLAEMLTTGDIMEDIFLGAFATEQEALDAMAERPEPAEQLSVVNDGYDPAHPWRVKWTRPD